MPLNLDEHDRAFVAHVQSALLSAFAAAHAHAAVAKRISVLATAQKNKSRREAIRRNPFPCDCGGPPLEKEHAELEQLQPELGYAGKLRWVCQRINNGGKHSCGSCS